MTDKQNLTERQQAMDICLKACVNLYGYVTPRQFLKVFNKYNTPKLLKKELLDSAEALEAVSSDYYEIYENAIINTGVRKSVIDDTIRRQNGKPYYMPTEAEIAVYAKKNGYSRTAQTENLMTLLTKKMNMNIFSARGFIDKLVRLTAAGEPVQKRINLIYEYRVPIKTQKDFTAVTDAVMSINNSTRLWANCGYTPEEMKKAAE